MNNPLDSKKKIHDFILENPGSYLTKIAEKLDMNVAVVEQHLREMEDQKIVFITEEAGYKKYYINKLSDRGNIRDEIGTRKQVLDLVIKNPGLSLTAVAETLDMGISLARYHLNYLERKGSIVSVKEEGYKRYYTKTSEIGVDERKLLGLFRQEIPLKIVFLLIKNNSMQHKELLKHFDIAPSTLTYHLNKLLREDVICLQSYGSEKGYMIKNKKAVIEFLRRYKIHKIIKDFKDIWGSINYEY